MPKKRRRTDYTPEKMRRILAQRDREGWTFKRLAQATGIPVSTAPPGGLGCSDRLPLPVPCNETLAGFLS